MDFIIGEIIGVVLGLLVAPLFLFLVFKDFSWEFTKSVYKSCFFLLPRRTKEDE